MAPTNFDMDVLRALVIATELGGFGRAAERLGRSQSAISLQMKKLEDQVGLPLFRKNGRGVTLTEVGDTLLDYARRIVALNDEALSMARGGIVDGTVRIGVPEDLADRWLPGVLGAFHRAHPRVRFEAQAGRDLRDRFVQGGLDLALVFGDIDGAETGQALLTRLPLVWIGPRGYRPDPATPLPLALLDAPCPFRRHGTARLDQSGRAWRNIFSSPSLAGLWAAVEAGLGVTVRTPLGLPDTLAPLDPRLALPPLPSVPLELHLSPASRTPTVARLRAVLTEALRLVL